ncbi:MAG: YtxH domain-containing protein [Chloroflexi bacterium]|nr:YtxH domain-containing protein [Chloroflexota bacterium]
MKTETKSGHLSKGLVVGALVGAALGVLVAPQPGKQTRDLIRRKTGGYVVSLRERFRKNGAEKDTADRADSHAKVTG